MDEIEKDIHQRIAAGVIDLGDAFNEVDSLHRQTQWKEFKPIIRDIEKARAALSALYKDWSA